LIETTGYNVTTNKATILKNSQTLIYMK